MKYKAIFPFVAFALIFGSSLAKSPESPGKEPVRDFQLSIIPMVGTDGADAVNHTYRFSVNLFAGITGGVDGLEAGGFLNITRGNVRGMQVSGFGNLVSGDLRGFQGAGFANVAGGDVYAFRSAGFINVTGGTNEGFSCAGFANITGGDYQGFAGAGFANITGGDYQGFAGAGFANITGNNFMGFQGAGFGNFTGGDVTGPQLAGFMNTAGNLKGIQAAGFLNIAREVEGIQLGFINIADTITGIPIGFLSIVRRGGLRQFELSASDVLHAGAAFRIGVPAFYNIFSIGLRPFEADRTGGFGYGVGTAITMSESMVLNVEAHTTQLRNDWNWNIQETDRLNEGRLLLGVNTGSRVQLFAGAVLYGHTYRDSQESFYSPSDIAPGRVFHERKRGNHTTKFWVGGRAGIRIGL